MSDEVIMCEGLCDNESKYKQLDKARLLGLERKKLSLGTLGVNLLLHCTWREALFITWFLYSITH